MFEVYFTSTCTLNSRETILFIDVNTTEVRWDIGIFAWKFLGRVINQHNNPITLHFTSQIKFAFLPGLDLVKLYSFHWVLLFLL